MFEGVLWFKIESFWLKCILATKDVCERPRYLHHWYQHSISDPVIPHIAVYNAYGFVTEWINTSTVFVHVSDRVIGTGQRANTSIENQLAFFQGTCNANIKTTIRMQRKRSFYSCKFQEDTLRDCVAKSDWNTVKQSKVPMFPHRRWKAAATYYLFNWTGARKQQKRLIFSIQISFHLNFRSRFWPMERADSLLACDNISIYNIVVWQAIWIEPPKAEIKTQAAEAGSW